MIELNEEELGKISKIAKKLRPKFLDDSKNIEDFDVENRILFFAYSYEFLDKIVLKIKEEEIKEKFSKTLLEFNQIYEEASGLIYESRKELNFGKGQIKDRMINLFLKEKERINKLISFAYFLGKRIVLYDPEEFVGTQEE